ncbi:Otogelin [Actinoplanes sp. SE50]|uniref:hypothetical protein n=1 Tax=unclassified Actinoplanes TaxID=2626549 RepID=UPI00023EC83B|nr:MULTISPECIES: hypothetical protein [unclassified Actinoplanes]AEV86467.1 Otogelin [Actinoplanes sp. SE50/110]ATO84865.1 Otogelin [Actinoplanes sp. SE50]SLM02274.1 Otogelin [Actinoplanes sp. SE50/110]
MESPVTPEPSGLPPTLPRISDYWPDAPHRLGPPADVYELPGVEATRTGTPAGGLAGDPAPPDGTRWIGAPPEPRTGRDWKPVVFLVAVVILVSGGVLAALAAVRSSGEDAGSLPAPPLPVPTVGGTPPATPPVSLGTSPPATSSAPPPAATTAVPPAPAGPALPDTATFELADGVAQLRVSIGDVPRGLVKVSVGKNSRIAARTTVSGGTVRVDVRPNGRRTGTARLEVLLNSSVTWSLRMRGGVSEAGIDLSRGRIRSVDLIGGAATVDLSVPDQRAAIPITERGGIRTWRIVTESRVAARVFLRRGAGVVTLYGDTDAGVDRGVTLRSGQGDGGIRVDSEGGIGALTVQAR